MNCVNKNLREYRTLKYRSGLSDSELSHQVGSYLDNIGRYPYLDELSGSNSEPAIKDALKLNKDNITSIEAILVATNTSNINDAVIKLNNIYRDKEIEVFTTNDNTKVFITERPTINVSKIDKGQFNNINSFHYFNEIIDKLQTLYGIEIIPITNAELNSPLFNIQGVSEAKAFIYNGNIYINTDIATVDSPVHELLHLLLGSLKTQNPEIYYQIILSAEQFTSYGETAELYPNRTKSDLNEEVFVTELAKYLTGINNSIDKLPINILHEIFYNINRSLDTILMGQASVKCIPAEDLYLMNLKTIAKLVNSSTMSEQFLTSLTGAKLHRIMANKKSELMTNGELKEECS